MDPHAMDVFGTVKVGERGQIVVPSNARKSLDIKPGDYMLVVSTRSRDGLVLIKVDLVREMIAKINLEITGLQEKARNRPNRKAKH